MRSLTVRLQALLLLLTLVGGSLGLPVFDAVVYHSALAHTQPQTNSIAGESTTTTHGVTCALDFATRCGTGIAPVADLTLSLIPAVRTVVVRVDSPPPAQHPFATTQSRAPPRTLS
jgi:hypothetical protein